MTEKELREYVFSMVKKHGAKKTQEILYAEVDNGENIELIVALAKYGNEFLKALFEQEESTIH